MANSLAQASSTMCWGPMCSAASGDANSALSTGISHTPVDTRDAPNTRCNGGRSGESTTSMGGLSIFWYPSGCSPNERPTPVEMAITRSVSRASTTRARLNPRRRPVCRLSGMIINSRTSLAGSRICIDAMSGLGTTRSSLKPPHSGDATHNGAAMIPPVELRMS
ncbi:unannotated protein [freshwater metagenome]|uniref:Unannotated protein n=1 Tax=freshwater metagenome TaxID=449393 RepID=A0A6J6E2Q4_9ZZZZ